MPLFEYLCPKCDTSFEYILNLTEPMDRTCPECGCEMERVISKPNFSLKGGGWFKDNYEQGRNNNNAV